MYSSLIGNHGVEGEWHDVDGDDVHGCEVGGRLEPEAGRVSSRKDHERSAGLGQVGAAGAAIEFSADGDEVLIGDDASMRHRLGLTHHKGVLRAVRLSNLLGRGRRILDGVEIDLDETIGIVGVVGRDTLLMLLSESVHLLEDVTPAPNGDLLLDSQADTGHGDVAALVGYDSVGLNLFLWLISVTLKAALNL